MRRCLVKHPLFEYNESVNSIIHNIFGWTRRHETALIVALGILLAVTGSLFAIFKYAAFGDNALDLAIFRQVIASSAHGQLFHFTIHPDLYLGDHVDFFLLLFVPFYALLPHAETLLMLQVIGVALALWPLTLLARRILPSPWPLMVAFLYTTSFFVHNFLAFEFHTLVFVVPLLFMAMYWYERRRFLRFFIMMCITLTIREDVGLLFVGFGILALVERRSKRWWIPISVIGASWFAGSIVLAGIMNHGTYKFLSYYGWLGSTGSSAFLKAATHPWLVVAELFRVQNLIFLLFVSLVFAGIIWLRPRRLIPASLYTLAILLTSFGGDENTLRTHYVAPLLPFLFWAFMDGLAHMRTHPPRFLTRQCATPMAAVGILLVLITVYGFFTESPLRPSVVVQTVRAWQSSTAKTERALIADIAKDARPIAGYAFLASLADRSELYSMHYAFTGTKQLSSQPYSVPQTADTVLLDARDALFYETQFSDDAKVLNSGGARLRALLEDRQFRVATFLDRFIMYKQSGTSTERLYMTETLATDASLPTSEPIAILPPTSVLPIPMQSMTIGGVTARFIPLTLSFAAKNATQTQVDVELQYIDESGKVRASRILPPTYGLYPTTEWQLNTVVRTNFRLLPPNIKSGIYTLRAQLITWKGYLALDGALSANITFNAITPIGNTVELVTVSLLP